MGSWSSEYCLSLPELGYGQLGKYVATLKLCDDGQRRPNQWFLNDLKAIYFELWVFNLRF